MVGTVYGQPGSGARFDWGLGGAAELGRVCAALVVVDVLSFTTAVEVAVSRGIRVHPFPWGAQAADYARRVGRGRGGRAQRGDPGTPVVAVAGGVAHRAGRTRSCAAVTERFGDLCRGQRDRRCRWWRPACVTRPPSGVGSSTRGTARRRHPIGVIAAGERWPDGTLRPSVEDHLGAAAVLDVLATVPGGLSVEAAVALAALSGVPDLPAAIRGCVSGRELIYRGFQEDVEIAVQVGVSSVVPLLRDGVFAAA